MTFLRRIIELFRGQGRDSALMEEMEAHRAFTQESLERAGLSPVEAAAESRRRMGNVTLAREDVREFWVFRWYEQLTRHLRFSLRSLLREPGFAVTAVVTLALGSAATTTVFSIVDAELWRRLPYADVDRLVWIRSRPAEDLERANPITIPDLLAWRQSAPAFTDIATTGRTRRQTAQLDRAVSFLTTEVSANYFETLGRKPLSGRVFSSADAGNQTAVITARGRANHFPDDPNVVGRTLLLDGRSTVIVGLVATDDFTGEDPELFVPMNESPGSDGASQTFFGVTGRLAAGESSDVARQQIQAAIDRRALPGGSKSIAEVVDFSEDNRNRNAKQLYFFLGAAALVLALTIANVAGLVVSRAVRRTPEFALRSALGGAQRSLIAQMLIEAAVLAVPAALLGLVISIQAVAAIGQFAPDDFLYRGKQISVDMRAVLVTFAVSLTSTFMLALVPLGLVRRAGERASLGSAGRVGDTPSALRSRRVLLTAQLALTMTLLAGAGIFIKSFIVLTKVPLGFEPANGWSLRMTLTGPRFASDEAIRDYTADVERRLRGVAGVQFVSTATTSPLRSGPLANFRPADAAPDTKPVRAIVRAVGPEYFKTIGTPITRGRALSSEDRAGAPLAIVINEEFAREAFPNEEAVGKHLTLPDTRISWLMTGTFVIVGVASDIKEIALDETKMEDVYVAFDQHPAGSVEFIVRTAQSPDGTALQLSNAAADSQIPVTAVSTLQRRVDAALQEERFNLVSMGCFAGLALLMSAIGVYGAMAYATTARMRELGIRIALGASRRAVVGQALGEAGRIGLVAGAIGIGGALLAAKALGDSLYLVPGKHNGIIYGVTTSDPAAIASAAIGIVLLAIAASFMPAARAGRVDPASVLKGE
jgi:putative ABC transport system permease protein